MNIWTTIHTQTSAPSASLMRSPGVSYADQMVSLCGLLTRTVTTTSAPINNARSTSPDIRSRTGIAEPGDLASGVVSRGSIIGFARHVSTFDWRPALELYDAPKA